MLRDKNSKWYVTFDELNQDYYDPYCHGVAYLMNNQIIPDMYLYSKKQNIFWIDDVYVGMIAKHLPVTYSNIVEKYVDFNKKNISFNSYLFIDNVYSTQDFLSIWNLINN